MKKNNQLHYDVKIQSIRPEGTLRATATVNINEAFAIRGVKVMEGSKGLFVSMPSYKAGNGEYRYFFPCTTEARKEFDQAVMGAYEQALSQKQEEKQEPYKQEQSSAPTMTM
ncbi:MAG: SpoVG family protein [Anaerotignum propionicum]|uniref:SpoVG family protein n=1 Tax=Anaerotignum propionicum TaxID=28446 RepID=UPI002B21B899|nr:SpoVG family protein [Anaerotignum propionicum]MEA5057718.1 SpoVG family protein [Anaerotignum propionicum]